MADLVIYYSGFGGTKNMAEIIAKELGADIIEIKKEKPIKGNKFFMMMKYGMQATFGMCPKIEPIETNLAKYDRIILGSPVWAGKCASPINTFLKNYDCKDKIIAMFNSSGGGDNDSTVEAINKKLPNLKYNVALADTNYEKLAKENNEKLSRFIDELR